MKVDSVKFQGLKVVSLLNPLARKVLLILCVDSPRAHLFPAFFTDFAQFSSDTINLVVLPKFIFV